MTKGAFRAPRNDLSARFTLLKKNMDTERILDAVRRDDLKLFSETVSRDKGCLTLRFGRFPLLSLCYLYGGRKIARAYEAGMAGLAAYDAADAAEPADAYRKFKAAAGTALRLYGGDAVVSPAEMLAVLGETDYLKQKYAAFNVGEAAAANIVKICASKGKPAQTEAGALKISGEGLKRPKRILLSVFAAAAALFVGISAAGISVVNRFVGAGTEKNPTRVVNVKQLAAAAGGKDRYLLCADLTLPADFSAVSFSAKLDGGGHTLTAGAQNPFAREIAAGGAVSNLVYALGAFEKAVTDDFGFFTLKNAGTLSNITVTLNAHLREESGKEELRIGLVAAENTGAIRDCAVSGAVEMTGDGKGNCSLAGIAGSNAGTVANCRTVEGTAFTADTVDLAGIVSDNTEAGKITACSNAAAIRQTSASAQWNPNAAGIVTFNSGEAASCENTGGIAAETTCTDNAELEVLAGGIACLNYGAVRRSKNFGAVSARSLKNALYGGGVAAVNAADDRAAGRLVNNGSFGAVEGETETGFAFLGAVAGYCSGGEVRDNFASAALGSGSQDAFIGGVLGCVYTNLFGQMYAAVSNNYYVTQPNIAYGVAAGYNGQGFLYGTSDGAAAVATEGELKNTGVYF
jgi:hypothetical protein